MDDDAQVVQQLQPRHRGDQPEFRKKIHKIIISYNKYYIHRYSKMTSYFVNSKTVRELFNSVTAKTCTRIIVYSRSRFNS